MNNQDCNEKSKEQLKVKTAVEGQSRKGRSRQQWKVKIAMKGQHFDERPRRTWRVKTAMNDNTAMQEEESKARSKQH